MRSTAPRIKLSKYSLSLLVDELEFLSLILHDRSLAPLPMSLLRKLYRPDIDAVPLASDSCGSSVLNLAQIAASWFFARRKSEGGVYRELARLFPRCLTYLGSQ